MHVSSYRLHVVSSDTSCIFIIIVFLGINYELATHLVVSYYYDWGLEIFGILNPDWGGGGKELASNPVFVHNSIGDGLPFLISSQPPP